jgi:hypothetical protein
MKRTVGALGLLGLLCSVSLPAANAAVLWQPDLSTGKLDPPAGSTIYTQGVNDATKGADDTTKNNPGIKTYVVLTDKIDAASIFDNSCSCNKAAGWLDAGDADGTAGHDLEDPPDRTYPTTLLTGDPKWADVAMQAKLNCLNQNTGTAALVLRAAPKTKPEDPDSHYEFRYTSGNSVILSAEERDGITVPNDQSLDPNGSDVAGISLRIMKVVNGKWKMLAELNADKATVHIPQLNRLGIDHDVNKSPDDDGNGDDALVGGYLRFVAKGDLLQGFVSMDGKKFDKVLEVTDGELKTGLVGLNGYDWRPLWKEILVEDAP